MSLDHDFAQDAPPQDSPLPAAQSAGGSDEGARGGRGGGRGADTLQQSPSGGHPSFSPPAAHFFVLTGAHARSWYDVPAEGMLLGRSGGSEPRGRSFDDPRMSREHARISYEPSGWWLVDLGSRNGSVLNGHRITRAPLPSGAVIRMGDTLLVFREGAAPSETPHTHPGAAALIGDAEQGVFPGISAIAHVIRRRIARLAERSGHVLILGETGTGKERVARAMAPRSDVPPIVQNCAELTRELARSELFGHLRGAFTGAHTNRTGLVEAANDGVLFLDELGELPYEVQGESLRFLEDGMFRPVGALELRRSRARVVAATNVDLDEAVGKGTFRRDLLARLRASNDQLELPPLRARREDILDWARTFASELLGSAPAELWTTGALECLLLYPWPENLRELRGVVRELCDAHPGGAIRAEDLPERVRTRREHLRVPAKAPPSASAADPAWLPPNPSSGNGGAPLPPPSPRPPPRAAPTPEEIKRVLEERRGNVRVCAELLSIERTKFYRRCKSLGIDPESYRVP